MENRWKLVWPLQLIFIATFAGGFGGLLWIAFGQQSERALFVWMFAVGLGVAILLHLPGFVDLLRRGALTTNLDSTLQSLQTISGQLTALEPALTTLQPNGAVPTNLSSIAAQLAANGPVRTSVTETASAIQNRMNELTTELHNSVAQLRTAIAELNTKMDSAKPPGR
jgi:hypothetical protein